MRFTPEQIGRLRHRHKGYQITLATEVLMLLLLFLDQGQPWVLSVMLVLQALVTMVFVIRYAPLTQTWPLNFGLGMQAIWTGYLMHGGLILLSPLGGLLGGVRKHKRQRRGGPGGGRRAGQLGGHFQPQQSGFGFGTGRAGQGFDPLTALRWRQARTQL